MHTSSAQPPRPIATSVGCFHIQTGELAACSHLQAWRKNSSASPRPSYGEKMSPPKHFCKKYKPRPFDSLPRSHQSPEHAVQHKGCFCHCVSIVFSPDGNSSNMPAFSESSILIKTQSVVLICSNLHSGTPTTQGGPTYQMAMDGHCGRLWGVPGGGGVSCYEPATCRKPNVKAGSLINWEN